MARKTKKELAKREETIRTVWLIVSLLVTVLIFFTVSKMGTLGIFFNNLLSYLFGSLYIVPLLSVFAYGIYAVFFKKKYPKSAKTVSGLFVLNVFVILLNAYILAQTVNFVQLGEYLKATFALIASNEAITMTGGLFGNFLYCCIFVCRFNRECKCKCLKDEKCNNCCRDDVFVDFKMIIYRIY